MNCDEVKSRLGTLLDGELSEDLRPAVEQHLGECPTCRGEYEALRSLADELSRPPDAEPPSGLWEAIEEQLEEVAPSARSTPHRLWIPHFVRRPLAAAAVVILAIGLGWLVWEAPWTPPAVAEARIDFRPLLAQADGDIEAGINALLRAYGGEVISRADAAARLKVRVHAPDELPGDMRLRRLLLLNMGRHHQSLAFHYSGPRGHLLLLQCPPMIKKDYGNYECLSCQVGTHDGEGVRVGKLYLMHMTSENVCICIVSTLDEHSELPAALDAVQIDF